MCLSALHLIRYIEDAHIPPLHYFSTITGHITTTQSCGASSFSIYSTLTSLR